MTSVMPKFDNVKLAFGTKGALAPLSVMVKASPFASLTVYGLDWLLKLHEPQLLKEKEKVISAVPLETFLILMVFVLGDDILLCAVSVSFPPDSEPFPSESVYTIPSIIVVSVVANKSGSTPYVQIKSAYSTNTGFASTMV